MQMQWDLSANYAVLSEHSKLCLPLLHFYHFFLHSVYSYYVQLCHFTGVAVLKDSWILWVFLCLHGISFIHASIQTVATSEILKPLILFEEMWTLLSFKFIPMLSTKGLTMAHMSYAFNWQWQVWGFFLPAIK